MAVKQPEELWYAEQVDDWLGQDKAGDGLVEGVEGTVQDGAGPDQEGGDHGGHPLDGCCSSLRRRRGRLQAVPDHVDQVGPDLLLCGQGLLGPLDVGEDSAEDGAAERPHP